MGLWSSNNLPQLRTLSVIRLGERYPFGEGHGAAQRVGLRFRVVQISGSRAVPVPTLYPSARQ